VALLPKPAIKKHWKKKKALGQTFIVSPKGPTDGEVHKKKTAGRQAEVCPRGAFNLSGKKKNK